MDELYTQFDGVFFEKTRLSIVTLLNQDEKLAFTALKGRLGLSDGALYTHLEKLIRGNYVQKERVLTPGGAETRYRLTSYGHETFRGYVDFLGRLLETDR
ncbi:MAG TPA: transcriptional regulator [Alkalispirochaeta sp.]|nr:transcriptional regulator [Alkalispirochaeta sp.]